MQLTKRVFSWSEGDASSRQRGRRSFPQQAATKGERALAGLCGGWLGGNCAAEKLGRADRVTGGSGNYMQPKSGGGASRRAIGYASQLLAEVLSLLDNMPENSTSGRGLG
jgi:hypothetical protein